MPNLHESWYKRYEIRRYAEQYTHNSRASEHVKRDREQPVMEATQTISRVTLCGFACPFNMLLV